MGDSLDLCDVLGFNQILDRLHRVDIIKLVEIVCHRGPPGVGKSRGVTTGEPKKNRIIRTTYRGCRHRVRVQGRDRRRFPSTSNGSSSSKEHVATEMFVVVCRDGRAMDSAFQRSERTSERGLT